MACYIFQGCLRISWWCSFLYLSWMTLVPGSWTSSLCCLLVPQALRPAKYNKYHHVPLDVPACLKSGWLAPTQVMHRSALCLVLYINPTQLSLSHYCNGITPLLDTEACCNQWPINIWISPQLNNTFALLIQDHIMPD